MGQYAYAFTQSFLLLYNLGTDSVSMQLGNLTWPDSSFLPRAVDINQDLLVVVLGYVGNPSSKFTPCAYLLSRSGSNWTVTDTWVYMPPTNSSWQASLTNWDANTYSAKYDMSASFNDAKSQVLLGIQITNTFVLLDIDRASKRFLLPSQSLSNGKAIGTGKTVGWLNSDVALILVNTYSLNYIWSASQIITYNLSVNSTFTIVSIIPNSQQLLSPQFGPILLALIATPSSIILMLDSSGNLYILLPSPPGSYSDPSKASVSSLLPCIGGTYSSELDIQPCSLCPQGFSTYGLTGQLSCVICVTGAFCPLGSAFGNISSSSSVLTNINQARAYPLSPTSTRFDTILMENMFVITTTSSTTCLVMSPMFLASMIMLLGAAVAVLIIILKYCVSNPRGKKTEQRLEHFFKQTDVIGEGEFWIGGIVSFAIIFICICGYIFSGTYYKRYPIENSNAGTVFGCDPTLTNAQFTSGLMSVMVSPNDDEALIFELLDAQTFILQVDFVNTLYTCTDLTLAQVKDKILPLAYSSCSDNNGSLSLAVQLPSHGINLQFLLAGINTIGGIRLYLEGAGTEEENTTLETRYQLVDLMFAQVFSSPGSVLIEQPSFTMQLTKVINRTSPFQENGEKVLSASWLPYVSADINQVFGDESEYIYATSSNSLISLSISEGAFYVLNTQQPIVDEAELIFTDMLFTITCIEIFGFIFLIFKLLTIPCSKFLLKCYLRNTASDKLLFTGDERKMSVFRF
ncbi:unnamed protein product [Rotaria socialis]|uniref:Uncharacterized protein n=1 Tax=Rotaria socialis TaxID=392032 RepID=A0A821C6U1_9BILA|nr:unnamed protein product [Rotaria socialis]CAF3542190.1 unnamed protein product [Rotaria socialis]CAF3753384.1 unnamed protein product [Rotaria socialis]CAF4484789.1 unnamed protein product [Rotaria socialis]CAF4603090.1 unnamed protein product [Rotaria socialis]